MENANSFATLTTPEPLASAPSRVNHLELLRMPMLGETLWYTIQQIMCTRWRIIQDRVTSMKLEMGIVYGRRNDEG